jgi:hypothetical protein
MQKTQVGGGTVLTHYDNYATVCSMLSSQTSDAVHGQQLYLDEDCRNKLKHPCNCINYINTFLILRKIKFQRIISKLCKL